MIQHKMPRFILSLSFCHHDSCVTIASKEEILLHLEAERVFRKKHYAITCLKEMEELVSIALNYLNLSIGSIDELLVGRLACPVSSQIMKLLGKSFRPIMTGHHENHIGTTYPAGFNDAIIVIADGGSEDGTSCVYHKLGRDVSRLEDLDATPHTGKFYGTATQMVINPDFAQAHANDAGKLMGLSAFGKHNSEIWHLLQTYESQLNDYHEDCSHLRTIFGLSSSYESPWDDQRACDFAYCVHNYWVDGFFQHLVPYASLSSNLALAGGCALNIALNSRLANEGHFKNVFISPISSDSGQSLGAILYRYPLIKCRFPFLGRGFGEIREFDQNTFIEDITAKRIIAWFQGRSEVGPRALGHRSFLGLPSTQEMRHALSVRVKRREPYRPVAAIIPEEYVDDYFDAPPDNRFMTFLAETRSTARLKAPAIVHSDGTTRLQSISRHDNPILHKCLMEVGCRTGAPILMNSSFNVAGEPIVDTPDDALRSFHSSNADILYLNGKRIVRE